MNLVTVIDQKQTLLGPFFSFYFMVWFWDSSEILGYFVHSHQSPNREIVTFRGFLTHIKLAQGNMMSSASLRAGALRNISCWSSKMNFMPRALWHPSVTNWYHTATLSPDRILLFYHLSAVTWKRSLSFWRWTFHLIPRWCLQVLGKELNKRK